MSVPTEQQKTKCLIVGGSGFIGSHVVKALSKKDNYQIFVIGRSILPKQPLPESVRYIQFDINSDSIDRLLDQGFDQVIDLAYSSVPMTSFINPVQDVENNLPSAVNLIRACSQLKLKKFLFISSGGTVYGNPLHLPIDESHPTNPMSPYGITKLAVEKYAMMYHQLRGLPVVIVRPGNPYGPNQMGNLGQGFVGTAIFSILSGKTIQIFGEKGTIRDYIYISDLADGIVAALEFGIAGEVYNVGTGIGLDNRSIINEIGKIATLENYHLEVKNLPPRPFDVTANVLSSARLTYVSGWKAMTDFRVGLDKTWEWAKQINYE